MIKYKDILLPAVAGTSLMTVFSYIISEAKEKNFREPELLGRIEKKLLPQTSKKIMLPAGWLTHYMVGIALTSIFEILRQKANSKPTFRTALLFGGVTGLSAIAAWKLALKILPERSSKFYKEYYTQLFIAHFVFALTAVMTQRTMQKHV